MIIIKALHKKQISNIIRIKPRLTEQSERKPVAEFVPTQIGVGINSHNDLLALTCS